MDMSDRDQLIIENQKLVFNTLHKYYPHWAYDEDLQQVGMIGLCKAADAYDPEKGKFSTFATNLILNEIRREMRRTMTISKPGQVVSLNEKTGESDDDSCTLEDCVPGEDDVDYCYSNELMKQLTKEEKEILRLLERGYSQVEISAKLKLSKQRIWTLRRRIQLKWRKYYGN